MTRIEHNMDDDLEELEDLIDEDDSDLQEVLAGSLAHPRWNVRLFAALRLSELFQDVRAVPVLAEALDLGQRGERSAAANALWEIGDANSAGLLKALYHAPINQRDRIADALYWVGWVPDDVDSAVAYFVTTQQWRECILLGKDAVPGLVSTLQDWDGPTRRGAAWVLGELGDPRAVPALVALLSDIQGGLFGPGDRVCDIAAEALEKINSDDARSALKHWRGNQESP
jgi:HEAT repeat protein